MNRAHHAGDDGCLKLKIFYVYYHSYEDMPIHVSDVIEEFVRQGDKVHLFTSVKPSVLRTCLWAHHVNITNLPITRLNLLNRFFYSLLLIGLLPLCCLLENPTIIYERASVSSVLTVLVSRLFRIPYVCEINGILIEELALGHQSPWRIRVTKAWESLVYHQSNLLVAVTKDIKDWLIKHYRVPAHKIEVVTNGTNIHRFRPMSAEHARKHWSLPCDGRFYVGYLGTLTPWCGVELLIECASQVLEQIPHVEFLIGGSQEPYLTNFRERVRSKKLEDHFRFFGAIPWDKAGLFISSFDVAVISILSLPSGASPQKLYSYLACNKPVIGSDMGEVGDLLKTYQVGLTFTPGSSTSLAEKIILLLNDPKLRTEMGRTARQVVLTHHSWEVKVNQIKNILETHFRLDRYEQTHVR